MPQVRGGGAQKKGSKAKVEGRKAVDCRESRRESERKYSKKKGQGRKDTVDSFLEG